MRGELSIKGAKTGIFELTIFDALKHLRNIKEVTFNPAEKTGADYFDVLRMVYEKTKLDEENWKEEEKVIVPIFQKTLQELFQSEEENIREQLLKLGATDLDIALIVNNVRGIQEIISANQEQNIYKLAKAFRFLDLAKGIHGEAFTAEEFRIKLA